MAKLTQTSNFFLLVCSFFAYSFTFHSIAYAQDNSFKNFIGLLSNNTPSKPKYKQYACKTLDEAMACASTCEYVQEIDFRVSVEQNYVIRKDKKGTYITFKNLGTCAVWDVNNWKCEENDSNPVHYVYYMQDGRYYQYLLGINMVNSSFCAR